MNTCKWQQVNAWRLTQQYLAKRASPTQMLDVIGQLGGLQAQVMSAAELQLWARVEGLSLTDMSNALWQERSLIKTWAMRGTLHLLAARDFGLFVAARQAFPIRRPPSYFKYHGLTPDDFATLLEAIPAALSGVDITREQLADAVALQTGKPVLRELLLSGWGSLLKPSAFAGQLCFGPGAGQRVTFVHPGEWLNGWSGEDVEPEPAIQEVVRRFLHAYGPATSDEFARWWGITIGQAKQVFKGLGDQVEEVAVEGWQAWVLSDMLETLQGIQLDPTVRLLPYFDPYTLAVGRHFQYLMPEEHKTRVYRAQGWISSVVLVDGRIAGVWEYDRKRSPIRVHVELFASGGSRIQDGIEAEAERLGNFWGDAVEIQQL